MAKVWRMVMQARLLAALLVAAALLAAPSASAMPMPASVPCRDHAEQAHHTGQPHHADASAPDDHADQPRSDHSHAGHTRAGDHKSCCSVACGVCIVAVNPAGADVPDLSSLGGPYEWADQTGHGRSIPPVLAPPRFRV
ncbi:hypothetical protein ACFFJ7_19240 [Pseudochelatococcus lubricantis]|uniref:hypothetical protein n=1 Tax=Pseudochelatococcus lubricantis TaxID=1538102 RepID=UPI0035E4BCD3